MKPGELLNVGLAYVIGVTLAYAIIASFGIRSALCG
jgi:hypothetical protein